MRLRAPALALLVPALLAAAPAIAAWQKEKDGVRVSTGGTSVRLRVLADGAVRVVAWLEKSEEPDRPSLAVVPARAAAAFEARAEGGGVVLTTKRLAAHVDGATGRVTFSDEAGRVLLREAEARRTDLHAGHRSRRVDARRAPGVRAGRG